ncbi:MULTISPECIES: DUF6287 domain-containing protein [Aerococcus]|uniref:DUF6287 domain-containing protein n=1 Tax=Aerococcus TaxID=1375 RepID=UPI000DCF3860|nr:MULTISPECIES: DUF6287 domain-containing protein [Aerococcus]KAA9220798.1 hypothetical protein F6I39_01485 [Aerococcus loyolae]KAA9265746.1 hypothetical protein F6I19_03980 [Aerococcus loyolae]MCY3084061.1 DUF6287 domain-containing protein [Aerococcus mictus]MDK6231536.1 DUF6287 domain-containing protein [Aerococcus urinae]MDK6257534.1 DUF6287 domain-containing protein [Aerococcus urinae]
MKKTHSRLPLALLLTLTLLGCQNNTDPSTATSPSQESVSSESSSSQEESKEKESSQEKTSQEAATSKEESQSESQAEVSQVKPADSPATPETSTDSVPASNHPALDIDQIQQGDFSTLVGTWRNGRGQEFVIHEDGYVEPHSFINLDGTKREGQFLLADLRATDGYWGGAALYIVPAGSEVVTPIPSFVDASDKSRDRLLGGHTYEAIEYPEEFFYRVD